ncbi:class I adenylate-forming enzyme family protein [Amycolatopsis keratiniphila]|uniref:Uncharacterized protein n=1 Tax=Amycolatopsis keratiniphila subsp. keratiniphila TaxID=227715 RepID=A0A1W2M3X2_9PSEU|nr:class I adenylate-forming enzyme family protein [Amycolatopsis keratiniphila]ONF74389.1 hypothetical protein AVR91_0203640 [Amycolatopsis keratiniphila subsp. keratiniphila]
MIRTDLLRPVHELLGVQARERAHQVAFLDERTALEYGELADRTARLAGHLAALGVDRGDRVAVLMGNRVETAETYLAVPRSGGIAVCLNPAATATEVEYAIRDSGARVLVTDNPEMICSLLCRCPLSTVVVVDTLAASLPGNATQWLDYAELTTTAPPRPAPDQLALDDVSYMLYTSGTTGRPKGVLLNQRGLLWVVAAGWVPIVGLSADDKVLCGLPLYHSYALDLCVLGTIAVGATTRIMRGFSVIETRRCLAGDNYTVLPGVPTMFVNLARMANKVPSPHRLRVAISAGAILAASAHADFERAHGVPLLDGYGITETSTMVTLNWPDGARPAGSCGLPIPGLSVRLADPKTGQDVPVGTDGEVLVRGPGVMQGYHGKPAETANALAGGWYHTGDLAKADASGYLTITGRTKDLIIRGGENISPAEVEEVLMTAPGVRDAAVVGKPDERVGQVPVAFIVGEGLDEEKVLAHCRDHLAWFKVPIELNVVGEIPRTGSGKIVRHRLDTTGGTGSPGQE